MKVSKVTAAWTELEMEIDSFNNKRLTINTQQVCQCHTQHHPDTAIKITCKLSHNAKCH